MASLTRLVINDEEDFFGVVFKGSVSFKGGDEARAEKIKPVAATIPVEQKGYLRIQFLKPVF